MRDYKKYEVWKKAHQLVLDVHVITKKFSKEGIYGITSQLRRASWSIPIHIVEGTGRNSEKEFTYFKNIASGLAAEVEYLLEFSKELKYLRKDCSNKINSELIVVREMLNSFHQNIKK